MAKARIDIRLMNQDGQDYFVIDGTEEVNDIQGLVDLLRNGIKTKVIQDGVKKESAATTKYIFKTSGFSEELNDYVDGTICIRVANYNKKNIKALSQIEDQCEIGGRIKQINYTRVVAGILTVVVVVVLGGNLIAQGLVELLKKDEQYSDEIAETTISQMKDYEDYQESLEEHKRQTYEEAEKEKSTIEEIQKGWTM